MTAKQILGLFFISLPFLTMFGIYIYGRNSGFFDTYWNTIGPDCPNSSRRMVTKINEYDVER